MSQLKKRWCERLIADGKIAPYGVVRHCFTDGGGRENPDVSEDIMPTIDTRPDCFGVCVIANYSPSGHSAARVVSPGGIAPTVMESHGTVTAIAEEVKDEDGQDD